MTANRNIYVMVTDIYNVYQEKYTPSSYNILKHDKVQWYRRTGGGFSEVFALFALGPASLSKDSRGPFLGRETHVTKMP